MRNVKRTRLAAIGGLVAAGILLAACGGGSSHSASANPAPTSTTTPGPGGGRGRFSLTAFTTCMGSHGVTIKVPSRPANGNGGPPSTTPGETRPRGGGGGFGGGNFADRFKTAPAGVDPTKYKAALAACQSKLPTGGGFPLNNSAFQAYRSCLQDHGVTLPSSGNANINRSDPKVQAALNTCKPLLPAGGFGRTTTTTAPAA